MAKRKLEAESPPSPAPPANAEYTVLARRYRPQQFQDLVGQEPVALALKNALQSNRVAHAYLFTGARGVGKTSTARILAKALNCEKGPTVSPCDQCDMCRAIASGDDIDVLEIDGASNRGIDEVREIRQNVQFRPSRARYKIYIIDEVHMLTTQAFNALLKTLEEPPPHVKFIFATTEVQKIPITILSRCQRFDFAGIGTQAIVGLLRHIVAREGRQATEEALLLVARRAAGSMRDAQSLLDQLLAFGDEQLTVEQVHKLLGTTHEERVASLAGAVLEKKPDQALELLGKAVDEGQQLGELLDQLIDYWRDLLVCCAGVPSGVLSVSGPLAEILVKQARALSADSILAGLDILVSAKNRLRGSRHGRVLLEMALVRLGRLEDLVALSQVAQWLTREGTPPAPGRPVATTSSMVTTSASPSGLPEVEKKKSAAEPTLTTATGPIPLTGENQPHIWAQVLNQVGTFLAADLKKASRVAISGPNTLVVCFPAGYNTTGQPFLDPGRAGRVEEILRKITGQTCSLRQEYEVAAAAGTPAARTSEEGETASSRARRQRDEALKHPLVRRAMESLGAQIVHMDEGFGVVPQAGEDRPGSDSEEG